MRSFFLFLSFFFMCTRFAGIPVLWVPGQIWPCSHTTGISPYCFFLDTLPWSGSESDFVWQKINSHLVLWTLYYNVVWSLVVWSLMGLAYAPKWGLPHYPKIAWNLLDTLWQFGPEGGKRRATDFLWTLYVFWGLRVSKATSVHVKSVANLQL